MAVTVTGNRTNYARGAALERQVASELRDRGWRVARCAGSHGPADLIALHAGHRPWFIQCKIDRGNVRPVEWSQLWTEATTVDAVPLLADRSGPRGTPMLYVVLGDRPRGSRMADYVLALDWAQL